MTLPWWRETVVYQICVRSFFDQSGDGVGDLAGVRAKLDYLQDLGVETLWLTPFYASPHRDFGYDISDFVSVAPEYGDMAEFDALLEAVHARGMKLVLDMVLNHTSDQHPWFIESRSGRDSPRRDWYLWRDGRRPGGAAPPNNWRSMIGGRGWHHDAATDQWYWAQFLPFQPDLNYRNPQVEEAMFQVVAFWLEKGVDGLRLDIINALYEDAGFRDNPLAWTLFRSEDDLGMFFRSTERTLDLPESVHFATRLRAFVDSFDERERFLVGETISSIDNARRFCGPRGEGLNLVFLFQTLNTPLEAGPMRALIERFEAAFPPPLSPTWVFSNHDRIRRVDRLGRDLARARLNAALQLTVRGVPFIYYGEELGMEPVRTRARDSHDALAEYYGWMPQLGFDLARRILGLPLDRDESRGPMQWHDGQNAGFCPPDATPWLPVSDSFTERNVATLGRDPASILACYRRFLAARRATPALRSGTLEFLDGPIGHPRSVLAYRRVPSTDDPCATVLLNMSPRTRPIEDPDPRASILVSTHHDPTPRPAGQVALRPWEGIVLLES